MASQADLPGAHQGTDSLSVLMHRTSCRVCGSDEVSSLPIAVYAPFFRLRVDTSRDRFALYSAAKGLPVQGRAGVAARLQRVLARSAGRLRRTQGPAFLRTQCDFCNHCLALTLSHSYSYEDLGPLYADYRSPKYNAERISVEPSYRSIAHLVGQDPRERKHRNEGVANFLLSDLPLADGARALDLGGSDGKFIPPEVLDRFSETHIFDTSEAAVDESLHARGVRKIARPDEGGYAFVMCMHVLEHVGSPRQFVLDALRHLRPGGLLYLEVPLELDPAIPGQFKSRLVDRCVTIHEHINQFSVQSMSRLINSVGGLRLLKAEDTTIDCGWAAGHVGRYLAKRVD